MVNHISKIKTLSPAGLGASLLDKHFPEWVERINLKKFTIESTKNCVLGQLYGNVENGLHALGLGTENSRYLLDHYGFAASTIGGLEKNIQKLNEDWLTEINRRMPYPQCEAAICY